MPLTAEPRLLRYQVERGRTHPLGATPDQQGVNFCLYSEHATAVELLIFDAHDDVEPAQIIALDPDVHKTYHFWHTYVRDLRPGKHYAYRVDGPRDVKEGYRFDPEKVLIDPYAKGITKTLWRRGDACVPGSNLHSSMRCAIIDTSDYDWEGDQPLKRPVRDAIVYEMHVKGFTCSPTSQVEHPGTFRGVIEKIPYLKQLGVTAVELLPVFEFDQNEVLRVHAGEPLKNYWGYSTMNFFSPHSGYCIRPEECQHVNEFRDMVKALHRAEIGVVLDVVFNHTDEGNHQGPVYSFKGIDNSTYYYLVPNQQQYYNDFTGCGNTFRCNHPIGEKFILESLEYWVKEMHVDGFRFDEGSVLTRGDDGAPMQFPPVIWQIELSDVLADTAVVAEAWDAAGAYQVGYFPGERWGEWNGRFRDDIRKFVKGEPGLIGSVASRLTGSADLYQRSGRMPLNSLNFIDCHDGFTLNDLVCYNQKHNDANGEGNRDGNDDNVSWNCGVEGESDDPAINALRERQIKNFTTILIVSLGIPMFVSGDEVRRTQRGNNNAYCQDNELTWFDWSLVERHADLLRFWQNVIAHRKMHKQMTRRRFFTGEVNERHLPDLSWHGTKLSAPDWNDGNARSLAFTLGGFGGDTDLHVMMNMYWEPLEFEIPPIPNRQWYRLLDTALPSPEDVIPPGEKMTKITDSTYRVHDRSVVILSSQ